MVVVVVVERRLSADQSPTHSLTTHLVTLLGPQAQSCSACADEMLLLLLLMACSGLQFAHDWSLFTELLPACWDESAVSTVS